MPRPTEVAAACPRKPSQTSDDVGKPASSHARLARNTAGVQLPQQAMQLIAASTPSSLKRSEEHTSELQSLMRISYAVFCLKNKTIQKNAKHSDQYRTTQT